MLPAARPETAYLKRSGAEQLCSTLLHVPSRGGRDTLGDLSTPTQIPMLSVSVTAGGGAVPGTVAEKITSRLTGGRHESAF